MSANTPAVDPEAFVQCPYEENHKVRNQRLQIHLVQCRRNNPAMAKQTKRCPFNAKHVVPKIELSFHIMTCPDRSIVDREILHDTQRDEAKSAANQAPIVNHNLQVDEHSDNWEHEIVENSSEPFIFSSDLQQQKQKFNASRQPRSEPAVLDDGGDVGRMLRPAQPIHTTLYQPPQPSSRPTGVLPSTMKQVGIGRGWVRLPVAGNTQSAVGRQRFATASSAFGVDTLVGRPSVISEDLIGSDDSLDESAASVDDWRRQERKVRKRLKQILKLEEESANGKQLNSDQMRKVASRGIVEQQLQQFRVFER